MGKAAAKASAKSTKKATKAKAPPPMLPRGAEVLDRLQMVRRIGHRSAERVMLKSFGMFQLFRSEVVLRNAIAKATEPMPCTCPVNQLMQ